MWTILPPTAQAITAKRPIHQAFPRPAVQGGGQGYRAKTDLRSSEPGGTAIEGEQRRCVQANDLLYRHNEGQLSLQSIPRTSNVPEETLWHSRGVNPSTRGASTETHELAERTNASLKSQSKYERT
jgi:hypothetical protein